MFAGQSVSSMDMVLVSLFTRIMYRTGLFQVLLHSFLLVRAKIIQLAPNFLAELACLV